MDKEPIVIAALNQYMFCPRRCALMFIEGQWSDNEHTALGSLLHDRADEPGYETDAEVTLLRSLPLFSVRYGLSGKADIVEMRKVEGAVNQSAFRNPQSAFQYSPVEYKKGRRRKFENDDVQLCAQALCLEEMFGVPVPEGFIYHASSKRRRRVVFDETLRAETEQAINAVRELLRKGEVPAAILKPRCDGCSLRETCMPELTGDRVPPAYTRQARALWQDG